jgi:hypothetical protein
MAVGEGVPEGAEKAKTALMRSEPIPFGVTMSGATLQTDDTGLCRR